MTEKCVFCRIAEGGEGAHIIWETELVLALADLYPIRVGHAQIISRQHHPYFEDLPPVTASEIIHLGQRLSFVMKQLYGVQRVAFLFTGGDHAYAHAHVVPMHEKTDITSRRYIAEEKLTFHSIARASEQELADTAEKLRTALQPQFDRP